MMPLEIFVLLAGVTVVAVCGAVVRCKSSLSRSAVLVFMAVLAIGFSLRLFLAHLGHNWDLDQWTAISRWPGEGHNIYLRKDDAFVCWGPVWPHTLWLLGLIRAQIVSSHPEAFHIVVACFLSAVDSLLASLLAVSFGLGPAVFFLLAPVSIMITGFHSQFDNSAVLWALVAWLLLQKAVARNGRGWVLSAVVLGVSLMTKHIFIFFPLWLAMWSGMGRWRSRMGYAAVAYGVFLAGFLPWAFDAVSREAVVKEVFLYSSNIGYALIPRVMRGVRSLPGVEPVFGRMGVLWDYRLVWLLLIMATGWLAVRWAPRRMSAIYLLAMVAFASSLADQYLAIPLVACAIAWRRPASWIYVAVATAAILSNGFNIGGLPQMAGVRDFVWRLGFFKSWYFAQMWLVVLLVQYLWSDWRETRRAAPSAT